MLNGKITPTEGETLTHFMHKRGINVRYDRAKEKKG